MFHNVTAKIRRSEAFNILNSSVGILFYSEIIASSLFIFLVLRFYHAIYSILIITKREIVTAFSGQQPVDGMLIFSRLKDLNLM